MYESIGWRRFRECTQPKIITLSALPDYCSVIEIQSPLTHHPSHTSSENKTQKEVHAGETSKKNGVTDKKISGSPNADECDAIWKRIVCWENVNLARMREREKKNILSRLDRVSAGDSFHWSRTHAITMSVRCNSLPFAWKFGTN